jgi:hypothetical protein
VDQPNHGTVEVDPETGEITYTPDPNYTGSDSFTYEVCDLDGNCDTATVTVSAVAIVQPSTDNGGSLAVTGTEPGQPLLLAAMMLLCGLVLVKNRRRARA